MTSSPSLDKAFLQLCLGKRLIDKAQAKEIWSESQGNGSRPQDILVARGLLARHTVQALERELKQEPEDQIIGGYRLVRALGKGGMATVYLAEQVSLGRQVALKLMAPHIAADEQASERFLREARAAAAINHPNVISIIDVGHSNGQLFMALELVTGGDADQLAARFGGVLPEARALEVLIDCTKGLQALYEARLVHRDLKPANIFITNDGAAKLADLGLARNEDGADRLTVTGHLVGTPAFMSPEQATGDSIDIRSDIYALGATLFALVTGRPPFIASTPIAIAAKVLTEPTPDPRTVASALSAATARVVMTAMAKAPDQRYQTPNAYSDALMEALRSAPHPQVHLPASGGNPGRATAVPTPATQPSPQRSPTRRNRRSPLSFPMLTLWVLVGVIVVLVALLLRKPTGSPSETTVTNEPSPRTTTPKPTTEQSGTPVVVAPTTGPQSLAAAPKSTSTNTEPLKNMAATTASTGARPPIGPEPSPVTWADQVMTDDYGHAVTIRLGDATQRLRWIPPGRCRIGRAAHETDMLDIEPAAEVVFTRGIWMADTECTQQFFQAVTGRNPSTKQGDHLPVTDLTVGDAIAFTHELRQKLPRAFARLPSRAEWERACRAGGNTFYGTGNDIASLAGSANLFDLARANATLLPSQVPFSDGYVDLAPVGMFKPNAWGLYDLHGNVSEYVLGTYRPLVGTETDPMTDDTEIQVPFIKGGGYDSREMNKSGVANLPAMTRTSTNPDIGFRFLIESR